ncbi:MAG: alpha/beta hydrolase [Prevotellaceae bacterium]|jgi:pimeloyl-ACP methyl ester carboxylesterase|nr:alpha/beta hydrolase [Prevotellaceae bacterium]
MEFFTSCHGIPVFVNDSQKGDKTVVLLHGYLESSNVWEGFAALLSKEFRVITFDLPGNGLSGTRLPEHDMEFMADVTSAVLDVCGVKSASVTGHSMGGYVALAFARKYFERIDKLCLFHSTPNPDSEEKKANRDREIELIEAGKRELILRTAISGMFANENRKRLSEVIEEIVENAAVAEPEGTIACLRGMKNRDDMNGFLSSFTKPLMMIFGAKDNYISVETAEALMVKFPASRNLMLQNSGHSGFLEEAEISASALMEFLNYELKIKN